MFKYLDFANEALGYQGKDFFVALQYVIQKARDSKDSRSSKLSNLSVDIDKTIAEFLGATTYTRWDTSVYGGYVSMRVNTRQHAAFLKERVEQEEGYFYNNRDIQATINKIGYIDPAKGKLGGEYAKNRHYLTLNPNDVLNWDIEEAAAMVVHECGHIWGNAFYEGVFAVRSMALDWMYKQMINASDAAQAKKILVTTREAMGLEPSAVVREINDRGEKAFMIAATDVTRDLIDNDPLEAFTYDAAEQMADAYAVRNGCGPALMKARLRSYINKRRTAYAGVTQAAYVSGFWTIAGVTLFPPCLLFSIYYLTKALFKLGYKTAFEKKAPTVQALFGNIQKEMVQSLKESELNAEDKQRLIDDIEEGYTVLENARRNEFDLSRSLWSFVVDIFSDKNAINEFNERLQGLSANRLFVDAAKLKKSI